MCQGPKPSTLSIAISVRRSRTLMLMAVAITTAMLTSAIGVNRYSMPHNRSR